MRDTTAIVWDLPLRLFHWLLVFTVILAFVSVKTGWLETEWHWYAAIGVTFLWFFRFTWGFTGTATAQFSQFFPTPRKLIQYFRRDWRGIGHTPLGGLSVLALLALLAAMIVTGLFSNDDITLQGPLASYVDASFSDQMSAWHAGLFNVLLGLIALHIVAIFYYWLYKKNNLLRPMVTGIKTIPLSVLATLPSIKKKIGGRLLASVLIAALSTWGLFSPTSHQLFYQPPPAPTAPASSAAW